MAGRNTVTLPKSCAQHGAMLLAALLVVVSACSAMLLAAPGFVAAPLARRAETAVTLAEAKGALLAYALNYPERHDGKGAPGLLPCPDLTGSGSAVGSCSRAGGTTLGLFPWRTVRSREFRDHHGERLWYALSDNLRKPQKGPINSDTPGDLTVNGRGDVVAVILAPGEPMEGQQRASAPLDPRSFLEGENASGARHFTMGGAGNDQLVAITRDEMMDLLEQRLLGDVASTLEAYRTEYGAFPWLSNFTNPSVSVFKSAAGRRRGHLPFHWSGEKAGPAADPFPADVRWRWQIDPVTAEVQSNGSVSAACLLATTCTDAPFRSLSSLAGPAHCTWAGRNIADCEPDGWMQTAAVDCHLPCAGKCLREYRLSFPAYAGDVSIDAPTATSVRTRDVTIEGTLPPRAAAVEIRDFFQGPVNAPACTVEGNISIGYGSLNLTSSTTGWLSTAGIPYDLDVDAGELPAWFVANRWHHLVLVVYAAGEPLPGAEPACSREPEATAYPCLTLQGTNVPGDDKRALVIIAGRALPDAPGTLAPGQLRPSPALTDYFEQLDAGVGSTFAKAPRSPRFNDKLRVIAQLE